MNPAAFRAVDGVNEKAVFIHLTAGDAGAGMNTGGDTHRPIPFFAAREEGALRAIRFMVNAVSNGSGGSVMHREVIMHDGIPLERVTYANTVSYFLRLPDGNMEGGGYASTGSQSLLALRSGRNALIRSIDNRVTLEGWVALVTLLRSIVQAEVVDNGVIDLHVMESEQSQNPGDHSDHYHASIAAQEATADICATIYSHDTYNTRDRPANVTGEDLAIDIGTWAVTASGLSDSGALSTWEGDHNGWLGRSYARIKRQGNDCAQAGRR